VIGNLETPPARASGIQVEHTAERINSRYMGMTGNHDVDAQRHGINPQGLEIVHDEDGSAGECH
jgi:hypothetical protein